MSLLGFKTENQLPPLCWVILKPEGVKLPLAPDAKVLPLKKSGVRKPKAFPNFDFKTGADCLIALAI
jgi:hypothetical protein